jgi:hypothetical protein
MLAMSGVDLVDATPAARDGATREMLGLDHCAEDGEAFYDPWTVATEISSGVDRVHTARVHRTEPCPLRMLAQGDHLSQDLFEAEAAGHKDDDVGIVFRYVIPGDFVRELTFPRELVTSADEPDHFGDPVPRGVGWIEPFHREHTGPGCRIARRL